MKRPRLYRNRRSQGITLVELMIAMALSIVLLGGTVAIFLSSKQAYRTQEDLARIQENLRYGITRFMREVSAAGFMGCAGSVESAGVKVANTVKDTDFTSLIDGKDDMLTLRFARVESGVPVVAAMEGQTGDVIVDEYHPNYDGLAVGETVVVSDCDAIAVFEIDEMEADRLEHREDLEHVFGSRDRASAMVYKMDAVSFKLRTKKIGEKTVSSLYAKRLNDKTDHGQEILSGVEDFQVLYGLAHQATEDAAVRYRYLRWDQVPADRATDITSLRITMTVNPGLPVSDPDGKYSDFRRTTEFTVKLRNQAGDI